MVEESSLVDAVHAATGAAPERVERLHGGANNQVALVVVDGRAVVAKLYFTHPGDLRDRLGTEFGTLSFLWREGIRSVPQPLALHREHSVAFYDFVEAERVRPGEVGLHDGRALATLLVRMRALRGRPGARELPAASEGAFTIRERLAALEARFERLRSGLESGGAAAGGARRFVDDEAAAAIVAVRGFVEERSGSLGVSLDQPVARGERTLSPGDIGFHNALRRPDGSLVFVDFEYAGWDEVAQILAQACLAPEVPLPDDHRLPLLREVLPDLAADQRLVAARLRLLYPVLALKWSLIVLNEFMPVDRARRVFSGGPDHARRSGRVEKARRLLAEAVEATWRGPLDDLL